jgi:hypothetical protein
LPKKTSLALPSGSYAHYPEYQHGLAEMIFKIDPLLPHIESVLEGYSEAVLNAPNWTEADPPHWGGAVISLKKTVTERAFETPISASSLRAASVLHGRASLSGSSATRAWAASTRRPPRWPTSSSRNSPLAASALATSAGARPSTLGASFNRVAVCPRLTPRKSFMPERNALGPTASRSPTSRIAPATPVCPCNTSALTQPADKDYCRVILAFHVDSGEIEEVAVADRSVVILIDAPGEMSRGDWKLGLIIDDGASDEQAEKLRAFFAGAIPSPLAAVSPMVGEVLGVEGLPIDYVHDGLNHSVSVGSGAASVAMEDHVHEGMSEPAKLDNVALPWGPTLTVSRVSESTVNLFGREWYHVGLNGNSAPISWAG